MIGRADLEQALRPRLGTGRSVACFDWRPSPYRSSFAIAEVDVRLDDGTWLPLIAKDVSGGGLHPDARAAKPVFLLDPEREIAVYRDLLDGADLGTATWYGVATVGAGVSRWLLLERVRGRELYQVGEMDGWGSAARWLGAMHARFAEGTGVGALTTAQIEAGRLVRYDAAYYRRWPRRACAFAAATRPQKEVRRLDWLAGRYERLIERMLAQQRTLAHGELYASNVMVQERPGGWRVCPVDWEMAAVGPGLVDLAALTAGSWSEQDRAALALSYHAALAAGAERTGYTPPAPEALLEDLDYCRLHLAMQWLGWSPRWTQPKHHAHDWFAEAMYLAEKLGW